MRNSRSISRALAVLALLAVPTPAFANFVWLPLLYAYSYTLWWVVVGGLSIEAVVYKLLVRRSWPKTLALTLGANLASAAAGGLFSWGSLLVLEAPDDAVRVIEGFVVASPILLLALTTWIEYLVATRLFGIARSWRSVGVVAAANLPSVTLAVYGAIRLGAEAMGGGA